MNKQRKTSHILNVFQYDPVTSVVTLPSGLVLPTPDSAENSTKVATTAWIRTYIGSLSYATSASVTAAIANLVASAPTTLDTLNELATALGNDPNFATTITTSIGTKVPQSRTITINGTAYDLSADRAWTIASGVTSFNTRTGAITLTSGDVTGALGFTPYNSSNPSGYITASSLSSYLPLSGGTMTGALIVPAGDRGFEVNTLGGVSLYSNEINAGALGGTGDLYIGWRRTNTVHVGVNIHVGSQQGWDNPGGWNKNVLIDGTNHGRFRIKASNYTYGNIDVALWADSSVSPSHGINGSNAVFAFNGSITSLTVGGQTVIHVGNIGSQSVSLSSQVTINYNNDSNSTYQLLWGSGNSVYGTSQVYINPSSDVIYARGGYVSPGNPWGTSDSAFFPNGITTAGGTNWVYGTTYLGNAPGNGAGHQFWADGTALSTSTYDIGKDSSSNTGVGIKYTSGGYGRIRFYQDGSNHSTIHSFGSAGYSPSSGKINLDGQTGVNIGPWNDPDFIVNKGAQTYARGYRGIGNVAGTGEASYHPAGMYSVGNQWLYGTTYRNSSNTYGQGQIYFDTNYGYGMVGLYSSTRYQAVFAMGDAYKLPVDGTTTGSLYGLAWSHPNAGGVASNLNTHGLLVMENGTFLAAISGSIRARDNVMAPAIYDSGSRVAISRGEGRQYVEYSRYVYNNGAYSGSGWIEPSDLGVRYAASSNYSNSTGSLSGFDKTNPSFGAVYASNWFRAQGDCGLYTQDYGGHFRRNVTSYGTWQSFGYAKNGWGGYVTDNNYILSLMNNSGGDHGFHMENGRGWTLFHNYSNNCWGIGTDNTYSGDGFRCIKYGSAEYGWTTWSDRRAKENISSITGALDTVLAMRGVYFNYIKDEAKNKRVGFIAQELEQVLPEAVRYAEEIDEYSVEYAQIVSVLAEAIKEQDAKMTAQESKIQRLEQLVEQLINQ